MRTAVTTKRKAFGARVISTLFAGARVPPDAGRVFRAATLSIDRPRQAKISRVPGTHRQMTAGETLRAAENVEPGEHWLAYERRCAVRGCRKAALANDPGCSDLVPGLPDAVRR